MITRIMALTLAIALSAGLARAQGEDPGDGGPQYCWNCAQETVNGQQYSYCRYGSLVGSAACVGGGINGQTLCTVSGTCPYVGLELSQALALGSLAKSGVMVPTQTRVSMSIALQGERDSLPLAATLRNCQGLVVALTRSKPNVSIGLTAPD